MGRHYNKINQLLCSDRRQLSHQGFLGGVSTTQGVPECFIITSQSQVQGVQELYTFIINSVLLLS